LKVGIILEEPGPRTFVESERQIIDIPADLQKICEVCPTLFKVLTHYLGQGAGLVRITFKTDTFAFIAVDRRVLAMRIKENNIKGEYVPQVAMDMNFEGVNELVLDRWEILVLLHEMKMVADGSFRRFMTGIRRF